MYTARVRYVPNVGDTVVGKYMATFYHVAVLGTGYTPDEAILDLCKNLEAKKLQLDAVRINDKKYKEKQLHKIDYMLYKSGLA